ncbi:MAG TPA: ABC transporter ATP-binding protein [Actinomycetota bacterium]|nr:ABC transporter ATP-binding protein [Actinomycetota bacterium]
MSSEAPVFRVQDLRKVYREPEVVANDSISFDAWPGEAFGVLGPNGAGKSTLVKQLVGLLAPTSGRIGLLGAPVNGPDDAARVAATVSYLPQGALSLGELTVGEAVACIGRLRGLERGRADSDARALTEALSIDELWARQLRKLSGGQRRLVQLAMTLVGDLPVLILDEPTADIDPSLRRDIWALLSERVRGGVAVILVTHDVAEAEHVLDRVAILDAGRVMAAGTPAELKADLAHRTRIEVVVAEDAALDPAVIAADLGQDAQVQGRAIAAWVPADEALRTLEKVVSAAGLGSLEDVRLVTPTLEDVYLELGRGDL